jgi:hypothetical protein
VSGTTRIVVQSLVAGTREVVVEKGRDARYLPSAHLVYGIGGVVYAARFDRNSRRVSGGAVPIVEGVSMVPDAIADNGAVQFAGADAGTLAYIAGNVGSADAQSTLLWLALTGQEERTIVPARRYTSINLSPDGTRAAVEIWGSGE